MLDYILTDFVCRIVNVSLLWLIIPAAVPPPRPPPPHGLTTTNKCELDIFRHLSDVANLLSKTLVNLVIKLRSLFSHSTKEPFITIHICKRPPLLVLWPQFQAYTYWRLAFSSSLNASHCCAQFGFQFWWLPSFIALFHNKLVQIVWFHIICLNKTAKIPQTNAA